MNEAIEFRIQVAATADEVYAAWADVPHWHLWDPDTRRATLDGPPVAGARGRLTPRKGFTVAMRVVQAEPGRHFHVECPVLGNVMRFEHHVQPLADGVEVIHRVAFQGWLSGWLRRTVGEDVRRGLPGTLRSLKAHVERGATAAA